MMRSYAESPAAAPSPFVFARAFADETEQVLTGPSMMSAPHSEAEAYVDRRGREWARLALEAQYALRAERERRIEVVGADGVKRGGARDSERHIETLVGSVAAPRLAYQEPGREDLHPCWRRSETDPLRRSETDPPEAGCTLRPTGGLGQGGRGLLRGLLGLQVWGPLLS